MGGAGEGRALNGDPEGQRLALGASLKDERNNGLRIARSYACGGSPVRGLPPHATREEIS